MELEMSVGERRTDSIDLNVRLKAGAPCLGPGRYVQLKVGLAIELDDGTTVRITGYDEAKPELRVKIGEREEGTRPLMGPLSYMRIWLDTIRPPPPRP